MPGVNFVFHKETADCISEKFDSRLKETEYLDGFSTHILWKDQQSALGITKSFSEYPLSQFENSRHKVWMEGKIYNRTPQQVTNDILTLCENIFVKNDFETLTDWLNKTDGEFVICAYEKTSGIWAFYRDILGNLPLYFFRDEGRFLLSRDLHFIRKYTNPRELDRIGLAQFMLFSYLLGDRTFYQNIQKVEPATLFLIHRDSGNVILKCLREFNYSHKKYRHRSATENATQLARILVESCKNRGNSSPQSVLKLSGGYDSRAIAAALKAGNVDFVTDSWVRKDRDNELDMVIAGQVADLLNVPWKSHILDDCSAKDTRISFKVKAGLDCLGFVYPIRNARSLQQTYGSNITVFDGLCGDKFMPDIRPKFPLVRLKALLKYILSNNAIWSLSDIEALLGISQQKLIECIKDTLSSYPEKSLAQKHVHWKIHQRSMSKFFEGNDRGRSFHWIGTPFLNPIFYDYAMNCPDSQKTGRYLYTLMLKKLIPDILNIPYARNNATTPESSTLYATKAYRLKLKSQQLTWAVKKSPNPIRYFYKKMKKAKTPPATQPQNKKVKLHYSVMLECLQRQANIPEISQYFSKKQLDSVLQNPQQWGEDALSHLFTVLTIIEDFHNNTLTIDQFQNTDWYTD